MKRIRKLYVPDRFMSVPMTSSDIERCSARSPVFRRIAISRLVPFEQLPSNSTW